MEVAPRAPDVKTTNTFSVARRVDLADEAMPLVKALL
jgi:hypothetical protein